MKVFPAGGPYLIWEYFTPINSMSNVRKEGVPDVTRSHVVARIENGDSLH